MKLPQTWIRCALLGAALSLAAPAPVFAQATATTPAATTQAPGEVWLVTAHPVFSASKAKPTSVMLTLRNDTKTPQRIDLSVAGVPKDWTTELMGGGEDIGAVMVLPKESQIATLKLTPPANAKLGTYDFTVKAAYAGKTATLPVSMTLTAEQAGGVTLKPDLPALRGTAKSTFKYQIKLANNGTKDALFNLDADVPPGFSTSFTKGYGSDQITGIPVKAGQSQSITLAVKLNSSVTAGTYPIAVTAAAGDETAKTNLSLEVTGTSNLLLTGPGDRLSGEAVAGQATSFPFVLHNTGTAPANDVKMTANAPTGWTVDFKPDTIGSLAPDAKQTVNVSITPAGKAIAGDYMVTVKAGAQGDTDNAQFRVTVNTSTIWGIVGLAIIAVAVIVLVLAVLRYGRR